MAELFWLNDSQRHRIEPFCRVVANMEAVKASISSLGTRSSVRYRWHRAPATIVVLARRRDAANYVRQPRPVPSNHFDSLPGRSIARTMHEESKLTLKTLDNEPLFDLKRRVRLP